MHLVKYTEDLAFLWLKKLAQENGLFVTAVRESACRCGCRAQDL